MPLPAGAADPLAAWVDHLAATAIPICACTASALERLRCDQDQVDANMLGELIAADPLMTLKLMTHAARQRSPHHLGNPQTVTAAIVWLGIGPFFRAFDQPPVVEQVLQGQPEALQQIKHQLSRNRRASRLTLAFASRRGDPQAPLLHQAALLHGFVELLLWVREPQQALHLACRRAVDPTRETAELEREALGVDLASLKRPLLQAFGLAHLLLTRTEETRHAEEPGMRCISIALRIASNEALAAATDGEDLQALSELLAVSEAELPALIDDAGR